MPDFISSRAWEGGFVPSEDAAMPVYEQTPSSATIGEKIGAQFRDTFTGQALRLPAYAGRAQYDPTDWLMRGLIVGGAAEAGGMAMPEPSPGEPLMQPEDYNKQYAAPGKSIGSVPLPERIAKDIGDDQKRTAEANNILARSNWPSRMAAGAIANLMDLPQDAAMLIPGLGEGAVLARLGMGTGLAARLAARGISGAALGPIVQAPLSLAHMGMSELESGDYGMRQAMNDIMFAAPLNAAFTIFGGTLGDAVRWMRGLPVVPPHVQAAYDLARAAPVVAADTETTYAAMRAAVAQTLHGQEVDTSPFFPEPTLPAATGGRPLMPEAAADIHAAARSLEPELFSQYDALAGEREAARGRLEALRGGQVPELERRIDELRGEALTAPQAERRARMNDIIALENQRAQLVERLDRGRDTSEMAAERERVQQLDYRMRDLAPAISDAYRRAEAQAARPIPAMMAPAEVAARQQILRESGWGASVPQAEFDAAKAAEAARAVEPEGAERPRAAAPEEREGIPFMITAAQRRQLHVRGHTPEEIRNMTPTQAQEILRAPRAVREPGGPRGAPEETIAEPRERSITQTLDPETHQNLAEAEERFAAVGEAGLHDEEVATLRRTDAELQRTSALERGYRAAAQCLIDAGA